MASLPQTYMEAPTKPMARQDILERFVHVVWGMQWALHHPRNAPDRAHDRRAPAVHFPDPPEIHSETCIMVSGVIFESELEIKLQVWHIHAWLSSLFHKPCLRTGERQQPFRATSTPAGQAYGIRINKRHLSLPH